MRQLTLAQIGEYYQTAHFVRPVMPGVVNDYAGLMKNGTAFPSIVLGIYTGDDGKPAKLIVDGVLRYRAAQMAKLKKFPVEIQEFSSLVEALAAQLKLNIAHGLRITQAQRNARIKMLSEVYNWTVRQIADAVGLHFSGVSRVVRDKQATGAGKGGSRRGGVVLPHALPPRVFLKTMQNVHLTLSNAKSRTLILAAIHDPKRVHEVPRVISLLQQVATEASELLELAKEAGDEAKAA